MLQYCKFWLGAALVALALVVLPSAKVCAGEKAKGGPLFSKAEELTDQDAKDTKMKASHAKTYKVTLKKDVAYRIDLDSKDFDTFLRLEDAAGKEVAFNDDVGPKNLNSRIVYVASKAGDFKIVVTTFEPGKTGNFSLAMTLASDAEAKEARLQSRIDRFAESTPAQRKELIAEITKSFTDKNGKLEIKDAQIAVGLAFQTEDDGIETAKGAYSSFIKIFADAEDMRVASVSKFLEREFTKVEKHLGKAFPVTGKTVDGKEYDLKKMKGKVVLVDFWATWCGPCIAELPNMESAYKKYHGKGFDIIGISLDRAGDDDKLSKFIENRKMPWPCINIEDSRTLANTYAVNAIPFPVLVDANGRVVSLRARGPQLERLLERLLGGKK